MSEQGMNVENEHIIDVQQQMISEQTQRIVMLEAAVRQLMTQLTEAKDETVVPIEAAE